MIIFDLDRTVVKLQHMYEKGGKLQRKIASILMVVTNIIHSCDIPLSCKIGKNVHFGHRGIGIVIHDNAVIGDNVRILHNVTIGGTQGVKGGPCIENNVFIGCGAIIIGNVRIGQGSAIAAGTVVLKNVPNDTLVAGVPAKEIKKIDNSNGYFYLMKNEKINSNGEK